VIFFFDYDQLYVTRGSFGGHLLDLRALAVISGSSPRILEEDEVGISDRCITWCTATVSGDPFGSSGLSTRSWSKVMAWAVSRDIGGRVCRFHSGLRHSLGLWR
jgi:hypothetical protein